jgi:hypothetical protein
MKLEVTHKNIKSIAKMIEKVAKNKTMFSQTFYPTSKKEKVILNNLGIDKRIITESNLSKWNTHKIETDFMFDKHFIRVSNNKETECDFGFSEFRAFIIDCGNVVEFKNNIITIRTEHPTKNNQKAIEKIYFS